MAELRGRQKIQPSLHSLAGRVQISCMKTAGGWGWGVLQFVSVFSIKQHTGDVCVCVCVCVCVLGGGGGGRGVLERPLAK